MRKIFFYSLIIFFITNISKANTFRWTKGSETFDGNTVFYYDKKTIYHIGSYKFFWQLVDYRKDYDEDKSLIAFTMVDCEIYNLRWISYTGYSEHMGNGKVTIEYIVPEVDPNYFEWQYFNPENTAQGAVMKKVCKSR